MEILCLKEDLYSGVQAVERIVSTRSTLPIVGNILFEAKDNKLKVSANNLEMGIEIIIPAEIKEEGSLLLPAKTLAGIVAKLPSEKIKLKKQNKGVVKISYKQSYFNINSLSPEEFPALPKEKESKLVVVNRGVFSDMIKQTTFSVSTSEDKFVLNGVLLETGEKKESGESNIRMIATDGFRLSKCGDKISGTVTSTSVIIPSKALIEVNRIILNGAAEDEIKINISNEQISFRYKDVYLVSRLIQGQFPDYKQVIPKKSTAEIVLNKKQLLESCERAAVIASGSANIIKTKIDGGKMQIIANTPDVGSIEEVIDVESMTGEENSSIAFNVRLITDVLKVIDSERIKIGFSGPLSPGVIRPDNEKDFLYIIMPIRTTDTVS